MGKQIFFIRMVLQFNTKGWYSFFPNFI
jgi:hypothetical protein